MCGIVGQIGAPGTIDVDRLVTARDMLRHRGPDDAGIYINSDSSVGLGHRRLSVIDLSTAGTQPMPNRTRTLWLVFNGEIYNFRVLRRELEHAGHVFASATDSEVIIHAYEEWGVESVRRLRGMFAYALWDERKHILILVRDRLGIKPLYYWHDGHDLSFGSELRAVMADPRVPRHIDQTAIYDFLTYQYIPTPKTIYADVKKLPAGHYAICNDERMALTQYWDIEPAQSRLSASDALDAVRHRLVQVVADHLVADVPVGVLLSGGIDSSTITAVAMRDASPSLNTFTIGFDVEEHSEADDARSVAEALGTRHHELIVTQGMALAHIRRVIDLYDEPYADGSAIPTLLVSELARRHVTVALSGEGGDEVFGGYKWYVDWLRLTGSVVWPAPLRRVLFGLPARILPTGFKGQWTFAMKSAAPLERYAKLMGAFLAPEKKLVLAPRFLSHFRDYDDLWHLRQYWRPELDPMLRLQYLDMKTYLPDDLLTKFDRATMSVSLEGRVPLLDHELVELVLSIPAIIRNPQHKQKHLLKQVVADMLPASVLHKKKKGFSVPWYAWLGDGVDWGLTNIDDGVLHHAVATRAKRLAPEDLWRLVVMNNWLGAHA